MSFSYYPKATRKKIEHIAWERLNWKDDSKTLQTLGQTIRKEGIWSVVKVTEGEKTTLSIVFSLLHYHQEMKTWGIKQIDESMGPSSVDCPLDYLTMVPCPGGIWSERWRDKVKRVHINATIPAQQRDAWPELSGQNSLF